MRSQRGFLAFLMICIILDPAKSFPVQQEPLDGASAKTAWEESNKVGGGMDGQRTTPSLFSCFDSDICRAKLDFCSEKRKACEKCEDYTYTCGTNIQPTNCTLYCVDLLVAKKLQEIEEAKNPVTTAKKSVTSANTYVTSEKPPESKSEALDIKWLIIGIMGFCIILLLVILCFICKRRQYTKKQNPETELQLLEKDDEPVEMSSLHYNSVPQEPDQSPVSPTIASAPSLSEETSDPDQTKLKKKKNSDKYLPITNQGQEIGDLSRGQQHQADEKKKNSSKLQQQDVDDETTSSGYSSTSSSPKLIKNQITINLNTNSPSAVSTSSSEKKTHVEDQNENIPFGKQESGRIESGISLDNVHYKNQSKPVSDENKFTKIVLRENSMDLTDDIKESGKKNVT